MLFSLLTVADNKILVCHLEALQYLIAEPICALEVVGTNVQLLFSRISYTDARRSFLEKSNVKASSKGLDDQLNQLNSCTWHLGILPFCNNSAIVFSCFSLRRGQCRVNVLVHCVIVCTFFRKYMMFQNMHSNFVTSNKM